MFRILGLSVSLLALSSISLANHYPAPGREVSVPFPPDASPVGMQHSPDAACMGDVCLVAWMAFGEQGGNPYEIRAARVSRTGTALGRSFTIATPNVLNTSRPQVAVVGSRYAVFYGGALYATVSADGVLLTADQSFSFSNRLVSIQDVVTTGGTTLVYWEANQGPLIPYLTLLDADMKELRDIGVDGRPLDIAASPSGFVVASETVGGVKLTRLRRDGSVASEVELAGHPQRYSVPEIAATDDSAIVVWRRSTDGAPSTVDVSVVSASGATVTQTLDRFVASYGASAADVAVNGNEYLVTWSRPSSGHYTNNVYFRRVSTAGVLLDAEPKTVSARPFLQMHSKTVAVGSNHLVLWSDSRYGMGHDHVFGTVVATGAANPDFLISRSGPSQDNVVLASAAQVVAMAWNESSDRGSSQVMFLPFDEKGSAAGSPIRLSDMGGAPAIAAGERSFAVAWNEPDGVLIARINADTREVSKSRIAAAPSGPASIALGGDTSAVVWPTHDNIMLAIDGGEPKSVAYGFDARIAFDGQQFWLVTRTFSTIEARRISLTGAVVDAVPFVLASDGADQMTLSCGAGSCIAAWRSHTGIDAATLSAAGAVPTILTSDGVAAARPSAAWTGDRWLVTWEAHNETDRDIFYAEVSATGNAQTAHRAAPSETDERSPAVAAAGNGRVFAFTRPTEHGGDRIHMRFDAPAQRRRAARP